MSDGAQKGGRTPSAVVLDLVRGMRLHGALDSARLMAFDFFLSIVPLLVLLGFILGRLVRKRGVEALVGPLLDTMPDASANLLRHELERLAGSSVAPIAPLSAVMFLWLTSSGVHQMMDVFEVASRASPRPWLRQRALAMLTVVVGVAAISLTAWGLVLEDDALHESTPVSVAPAASAPQRVDAPPRPAHDGKPASPPKKRYILTRTHAKWERVAAAGVIIVVGLFGLALFYRYAVEHPPGVVRRAWPGALIATSSWLVVSWVFGSYLGSLRAYAVYYGGLAAVAVLLVWLFLTSLALLLGAEVNAMLEGVGAHS